MKRITTLLITAVLAGGCSDTPERLTGVARSDDGALRVFIEGPRLITAPGIYEWTAFVSGGAGELAYEWSVDGPHPDGMVLEPAAGTLRMSLANPVQGELQIHVAVWSGAEAVSATEYITMCEDRRPVDWCFPDRIVAH